MALRRQPFQCCVPFGRLWIHDEWMAFALVSQGGRLAPILETLIDYRQHAVQQLGMREARLKSKIYRILNTNSAEYFRKTDQVEEIGTFLKSRHAPEHVLALLHERIFHVRRRAAIGDSRSPDRLLAIWEEWRSGRYAQYFLVARGRRQGSGADSGILTEC